MQDTPSDNSTRGAEQHNKARNTIVLFTLFTPQRFSYPPLPGHLDQLLKQPWSSDASMRVDRWLHYSQLEF